MQLVLVSLVPAISGLALAAVCGMSFLSYADQSPMMFKLVGVMGLLMGMVGVLMPPAFWLMGAPPRDPAAVKAKESAKDNGKSKGKGKADEDEEEAEDEESVAASGTMDADGVEFADAGESDAFAQTDTNLEVFDDESMETGSDDFVDEVEEEEEAPKKKKKR